MDTQITQDQIMQIIGQKEVEVQVLRQQVQQLQQEVQRLKQANEEKTE